MVIAVRINYRTAIIDVKLLRGCQPRRGMCRCAIIALGEAYTQLVEGLSNFNHVQTFGQNLALAMNCLPGYSVHGHVSSRSAGNRF